MNFVFFFFQTAGEGDFDFFNLIDGGDEPISTDNDVPSFFKF